MKTSCPICTFSNCHGGKGCASTREWLETTEIELGLIPLLGPFHPTWFQV